MASKYIKIGIILLFLATFTGCPETQEDCFQTDRITRVDDLIKLEPLQEVYNQGDTITLKVTIPAINNYFGEELNIFELTNDFEGFLLTSYSLLFKENELMFVKGSQGSETNWFNVPFNTSTGNYEFELKVKLLRIGLYNISTSDYIAFQGSVCDRFRLDTNIQRGETGPGEITFTVQ